jgi:hypothetical protein
MDLTILERRHFRDCYEISICDDMNTERFLDRSVQEHESLSIVKFESVFD